MRKHKLFLIDMGISTVFIISVLMSYAMDKYRIACFVFACIALLSLGAAVVTYTIQLKMGKHPPHALIICFLIISSTGAFYIQSTSNNNPLYFILISAILALIISLIAYIKVSFKGVAIAFLINMVACIMLYFSAVFYVNYAFDITLPTEETFVIKEISSHTGSGTYYTYIYAVEYIGDNEDVLITELELKSKYIFEEGDVITVKFRKGLFDNLYKVDYTNAERDSEYFFKLKK